MRRFALPSLVAGAAVALLALLLFGVANQGTDTSIDAAVARGAYPLPSDASMKLPILGSSRTESLADLRGKVVVLNVFASWCEQCKTEAPALARAQREIVGKNATILGVTYQDNSDDSERFVRQEQITYPVLRDIAGGFVRAFGTIGVPETFVIDRSGRIVALRRFQLDSTWLNQTLPKLLAQPS